jgi:single-strand DNA-binding protein
LGCRLDIIFQALYGLIKVNKFSLATSELNKDDKGQVQVNTECHNIVLWGGSEDLSEKYIHKGFLEYIRENKNQKL